jgi:hypothetical protein
MADPHLDTSAQRPATGLDAGARELILRSVTDQPGALLVEFFHVRFYARYDDYIAAVNAVWGGIASAQCTIAIARGAELARQRGVNEGDGAATELLLAMPEPDFRSAIHTHVPKQVLYLSMSDRITEVCRGRGAPWRYSSHSGWEWTGDEEIEKAALRPALSAIGDARFAGGVKSDFESARSELALGTPKALSQSVHQSGCAVESAMKVLLDEHKVPYDRIRDTMNPLLDHLVDADVVPREMQDVVLGPMTPRNRWGGHGAGAAPHDVSVEEAESVFASAAVAIAFLHTRLPHCRPGIPANSGVGSPTGAEKSLEPQ